MILNSNTIISFSAGILTFGISSYVLNEQAIEWSVFVFFSTLTSYNLLRIIKFSLQPNSLQALANQKYKFVFYSYFGIGVVGLFYSLFYLHLSAKVWVLIVVASIVCLLYVLPLFSFQKEKKALRDIPGLKIYIISATWSIMCFYIPAIDIDYSFAYFMLGFIYILGMTIPFDIRDLNFDKQSQKTIPQLVGWKNAKKLSFVLVGIFFIGLVCFVPTYFYNPWFWIVFFLHYFLLAFVTPIRSHYYYGVFIDGVLATVGLLFYFAS